VTAIISAKMTDEFRKRKGRRLVVRKVAKIAIASTFHEADFRLFLAIQLSCLEPTSFYNVISNSMLFEEISFKDFTIDKLIEIGKRMKISELVNLNKRKLLLSIIILII